MVDFCILRVRERKKEGRRERHTYIYIIYIYAKTVGARFSCWVFLLRGLRAGLIHRCDIDIACCSFLGQQVHMQVLQDTRHILFGGIQMYAS